MAARAVSTALALSSSVVTTSAAATATATATGFGFGAVTKLVVATCAVGAVAVPIVVHELHGAPAPVVAVNRVASSQTHAPQPPREPTGRAPVAPAPDEPPTSVRAPDAAMASRAVAPAPKAPAATASRVAAHRSPRAAASESLAVPAPVAPSAPPPPPPPAALPPALAREVGFVDSAKQELAAGRPDQALSIVARYRREVGEGQLAREIALIEVDALTASGDAKGAAAAASAFVAAYPMHPAALRLRQRMAAP